MKEKIRVGYIGLGRRGKGILDNIVSEMADIEIASICDVQDEKLEAAKELVVNKGRPAPALYKDHHEMLKDPTLDAVFVMTGWNGRIGIAIDAMYAGKYAAIEVGCAFDLNECYALVEAYEKTGMPVMMLENCCYGRREMMALRMVKEGLFGEIVHCDGGYRHYLPEGEFFPPIQKGSEDANLYLHEKYTSHYRLAEYANRNCENYPTHELGPISKVLNINRGNRMLTLTSFGGKSRGLPTYIRDHVHADHPFANTHFNQSDIVTTIITCAGGEQIHLTLDTTLPRAYYSRQFTVRGTKGMCEECGHYNGKSMGTFFLEGMEIDHVFDNEEEFFAKYDHPLHADYVKQGARGGHGGMDWLVVRAFVESVKNGTQTPIDVYDTAAWLAIGPLSEMSLANGSTAVAVPDFTRGRWFHREPPVQSKYSLDVVVDDPDTPIFPE